MDMCIQDGSSSMQYVLKSMYHVGSLSDCAMPQLVDVTVEKVELVGANVILYLNLVSWIVQ